MKNNKLKYKIATGVTLLLVGTLVLFSNEIKEKRDVVFSEMNLTLTNELKELEKEQKEQKEQKEEKKEVISEEEPKQETNYHYENYLGTIEINKINLYKGFYSKTSNLNNVNINLYVLPQSDYPDKVNGNLMIAGHSGNYNNSYFRNLYLLKINDEIKVNYNNKQYIYTIEKIYNEPKIGKVRILRNASRTTLTLVTCTKDDEYHQTVYIAYLNRVI